MMSIYTFWAVSMESLAVGADRILVCAVVIVIGVSPKMLIQRCGVGAHVMTHGVQELHPCIRVAVIAIDAGFDESLFQRAERVAYLRVQIAHSCIVHSRKFSVPEAILSNGTRKLLWFENTEMLTALKKYIYCVIYRYIFVPYWLQRNEAG